jgi:hypothetical protein
LQSIKIKRYMIWEVQKAPLFGFKDKNLFKLIPIPNF